MKYSVILSNVGSCCDRYAPNGYGRKYSNSELFERLSHVEGISGVELIGQSAIHKGNIAETKENLERYGLEAVAIIPDHFSDKKWKHGAFTGFDPDIRKQAVEETMKMADCARQIGCKTISIWNGQDGFDYPFQVDYLQTAQWLAEGIRECAEQFPDINFSIEYKPKEPRNHSFVSNVYSTILLTQEIGMPNVGVTIDTGHAAVAYENLANAVAAAARMGKLFHIHYNDNYGFWDDDMIAGSVHTLEYIEFVWWLKKCNYQGWLSVDQYPYREDGVDAVNQSVQWMHAFEKAAERIAEEEVMEIFRSHDAVRATAMLRCLIFG